MKTSANIPFNYLSYWARIIPPPVWVERLDSFYKGTEDLDFYCLKIEGDEASFVEPSDYAKYTIEQFKFEEDFGNYYAGS